MNFVKAGNEFLFAFAKSFGVILASEIGDKTFFIAAVMAMRNPRMTVGCTLCKTCLKFISMHGINLTVLIYRSSLELLVLLQP